MTAGRGIVHSEMPQITTGDLHGFQLWINLPKKDKMIRPRYQDYQVSDIPTVDNGDNANVRVMAGSFQKTTGAHPERAATGSTDMQTRGTEQGDASAVTRACSACMAAAAHAPVLHSSHTCRPVASLLAQGHDTGAPAVHGMPFMQADRVSEDFFFCGRACTCLLLGLDVVGHGGVTGECLASRSAVQVRLNCVTRACSWTSGSPPGAASSMHSPIHGMRLRTSMKAMARSVSKLWSSSRRS